jgi:sugar phosphate isomerase/epimerase
LICDVSHVVASGSTPREFVQRLGERITHVHLRDAEPGYIHHSIGTARWTLQTPLRRWLRSTTPVSTPRTGDSRRQQRRPAGGGIEGWPLHQLPALRRLCPHPVRGIGGVGHLSER